MVHTHPQHPPPPQFEMEFLYFLIFQEMKLCSFNILKKIAHIFSKESISYISENRTLHFSAQSQEDPEKILCLISL